ncbi:cytochrome c class I [Gemmatirosa kalamazoonensis]|uniref:Cytochrome c class I n=1 Tax=Gemmatirosa kalamazoonensis TaxID=861299 RepID=W0RCQ1_9BACT|nr:c-type cytochrome [Gemmatirosa kalamazoonensis]AHG88889.1 cytochrome c class I [Gemmatirosa kalamazoonensis]
MSASTARTIARWTLRVLAVVVVLVLTGVGVVYGLSERRLRARFATPDHAFAARDDAAAVARGKHLVTTRGCMDCHGENLAGRTIIDDPMIGRLTGANLTRGGRGAALGDRDWELAVRHGLRADGSALLVMPSQEMTGMSDEDLAAIVAYARSVPAVGTERTPPRAGPLIRALYLGGQVKLLAAEQIDHAASHVPHVDVAPTAEYGRYVAAMCTGCHGPGYSGGKIPGAPPDWGPAANITPAGNPGRWSEAEFVHALTTGTRPDGSRIDGKLMPLKIIAQMDTVELRAVYQFLRTLPPRPYGNR